MCIKYVKIVFMKPQDVFSALQANPDARLIDVREPEEYREVHAVGAELFQLTKWPDNFLATDVATDAQLYIICRSGGRSSVAIELLKAKGFTNVTNVDGGTNDWVADKLPVVTNDN